MKTQDDLLLENYNFDLPQELIAQRPDPQRDKSRLLIYKRETGQVIHEIFENIANYLPSDSTIVFNNSKVFPCRLLGQKTSGGAAEVFILSLLKKDGLYSGMCKASGKRKIGDIFIFENDLRCEIKKIDDGIWFEFNCDDLATHLSEQAKIPIPPYIRNGLSDEQDREDYQTIYAKHEGSVAAPTAGLHFTKNVFGRLADKNIFPAYVTLHVGAGTFAPVKSDKITDHNMHYENFFIEESSHQKIKENYGKLIAVGTTSLRVLESAENYKDGMSETNIFLYPGKKVKSIQALITNFHLPKSSLIMLVSSLIGREKALELYRLAIEKKYRFFSYGDAMLII